MAGAFSFPLASRSILQIVNKQHADRLFLSLSLALKFHYRQWPQRLTEVVERTHSICNEIIIECVRTKASHILSPSLSLHR